MKFIVSSTGLFSHLQAISRVINSKNSLPILDCFLMELTDGTLSITASDITAVMLDGTPISSRRLASFFASSCAFGVMLVGLKVL